MTTYLIDNSTACRMSPVTEKLFREDFSDTHDYPAAIQRALDFICKSYTDQISLSDAANRAFISSSHLSYLFRQHMGMRYKYLVLELRIRKAVSLIHQEPRIMIPDLAQQSGFVSLSEFEKMFRRCTGVTPREYRTMVRG